MKILHTQEGHIIFQNIFLMSRKIQKAIYDEENAHFQPSALDS